METFDPLSLAGQPLTGSLTMTLDDPHSHAVFDAYRAPTASVTVRWRAKWWERPWLWLRRKPTTREHVYDGVRFEPMTLDDDGTAHVTFTAPA